MSGSWFARARHALRRVMETMESHSDPDRAMDEANRMLGIGAEPGLCEPQHKSVEIADEVSGEMNKDADLNQERKEAMKSRTRIYVVRLKNSDLPARLVRAANRAQALHHVAQSSFSTEVAGQDDLVSLLGTASIEIAGEISSDAEQKP